MSFCPSVLVIPIYLTFAGKSSPNKKKGHGIKPRPLPDFYRSLVANNADAIETNPVARTQSVFP
jgi:hypothetical protein